MAASGPGPAPVRARSGSPCPSRSGSGAGGKDPPPVCGAPGRSGPSGSRSRSRTPAPQISWSSWRCDTRRPGRRTSASTRPHSFGVRWTSAPSRVDPLRPPGRWCMPPTSTLTASAPGRSPQCGPQPGQQLVHAERLGHVVVGAGVEGLHLVHALVSGGQDDDRHRAAAPGYRRMTSTPPIPGSPRSSSDHVGMVAASLFEPVLARAGHHHLVALGAQAQIERLHQRSIVVADQHVALGSPGPPARVAGGPASVAASASTRPADCVVSGGFGGRWAVRDPTGPFGPAASPGCRTTMVHPPPGCPRRPGLRRRPPRSPGPPPAPVPTPPGSPSHRGAGTAGTPGRGHSGRCPVHDR